MSEGNKASGGGETPAPARKIDAPALFSLTATLCTAMISATIGFAQIKETARERDQEAHQTERTQLALEHQRSFDNARLAATMYFEKLGDLRTSTTLDPARQKRFVTELKLIASLTDNHAVEQLFQQMAATLAADTLASSRQPGTAGLPGVQDKTPSEAVRGLPDLIAKPAAGYRNGDFLAFPQVPEQLYASDAQPLRDALGELGFKVQGAERMMQGLSPDASEVRYYHADQKALAQAAAAQLTCRLGVHFEARPLPSASDGLPNGVMEIWLGAKAPAKLGTHQPCPTPG